MTGLLRSVATHPEFSNHSQSRCPAFRLTNYNLCFAALPSIERLTETTEMMVTK
jgi:hypothetical protein